MQNATAHTEPIITNKGDVSEVLSHCDFFWSTLVDSKLSMYVDITVTKTHNYFTNMLITVTSSLYKTEITTVFTIYECTCIFSGDTMMTTVIGK